MKHSRFASALSLFALAIFASSSFLQPVKAAPTLGSAILRPALQYASGDANLSASMLAVACIAQPTIVDEFAPHQWTGAGAAMRYAAALRSWAHANKLANVRVATDTPSYFDISDSSAWVSMPATFTYLLNGKPSIEKGIYTFVLVEAGGVWKVRTAAWATTFTK